MKKKGRDKDQEKKSIKEEEYKRKRIIRKELEDEMQ